MGKITGFLEIDRQEASYQPTSDRIRHYEEFTLPLSDFELSKQASRCMDCGIPFCHSGQGCPVNNQIPDWNDLVYNDDWEEASRNLHSTNNFPEFTGRTCPAPCEEACTLNIENTPVTIKAIECAIVDKAWENGWIVPEIAETKTGKKIAIIGSGPAGMAAAQQLARRGHDVHVFERNKKAGGLLRYGIPDFKMEKKQIDRRIEQLEAEGVVFHYEMGVGENIAFEDVKNKHDAVLFAGGAEKPRNPEIPGQDLEGVEYAMPFLTQQNRRVGNEPLGSGKDLTASAKHVVVIGGGDTASDCIGTSIRQGCLSITQMDIRPKPPLLEDKLTSWPYWPTKLRISSSQAEGAQTEFAAATLGIEGDRGHVTHVLCARVDDKRVPIKGTEFKLRADLVLMAIGFAGPLDEGLLEQAKVERGARGEVKANEQDYKTSLEGVFAAGDMRRGQSLVVWAIREGRQAARAIDEYLMGSSTLPR